MGTTTTTTSAKKYTVQDKTGKVVGSFTRKDRAIAMAQGFADTQVFSPSGQVVFGLVDPGPGQPGATVLDELIETVEKVQAREQIKADIAGAQSLDQLEGALERAVAAAVPHEAAIKAGWAAAEAADKRSTKEALARQRATTTEEEPAVTTTTTEPVQDKRSTKEALAKKRAAKEAGAKAAPAAKKELAPGTTPAAPKRRGKAPLAPAQPRTRALAAVPPRGGRFKKEQGYGADADSTYARLPVSLLRAELGVTWKVLNQLGWNDNKTAVEVLDRMVQEDTDQVLAQRRTELGLDELAEEGEEG